MKKILLVVCLMMSLMLGSVSYSAVTGPGEVRSGILAPIQALQSNSNTTITFPVLFVIDFSRQFDVQAGFGNIGQGSSKDAFNRFMIQGSWYGFNNGSLRFGPMAGFYTYTTGQKASDNTSNSFYFGLSAKKVVWENVDLKLDAIGFTLNSGKRAGNDIKEENSFLPGVVVGLVFNLF